MMHQGLTTAGGLATHKQAPIAHLFMGLLAVAVSSLEKWCEYSCVYSSPVPVFGLGFFLHRRIPATSGHAVLVFTKGPMQFKPMFFKGQPCFLPFCELPSSLS